MSNITWEFAFLGSGQRQGTDMSIEEFKGEKIIENLTREICQNSLDAKSDKTNPVRVVFKFKKIENKYPVFKDLKEHVEECDNYWGNSDQRIKNFIGKAKNILEKQYINCLVISDYNTTGLDGSRDKDNYDTPWQSLTGSQGVSCKQDSTSGGSYGVGKNAPFACSGINTVFYNTYAEKDNEKAFIGVTKLLTHKVDNRNTTNLGQYCTVITKGEEIEPIYDEKDDFVKEFSRNEVGTDVIIGGFIDIENWADKIKMAAIANFFVAICEDKLIVEVIDENEETLTINKESINNIVEGLEKKENAKEYKNVIQIFKTYRDRDEQSDNNYHKYFAIDGEENAVEIIVRKEKDYSRTVAKFRNIGMCVGISKKKNFLHYAAVVIIRGEKLNKLLREAEPPRHDKWECSRICDKQRENTAKRCIKEIDEKIKEILENHFSTPETDNDDPVWMSNYFQYIEEGPMASQHEGEDILNPIIKIGDVKKVSPKNQSGGKQKASVNKGTIIEGGYSNIKTGKIQKESSKPVVLNEADGDIGVGTGDGGKIIDSNDEIKCRAYPMSAENGIYKIILIPKRDFPKLYLRCFEIGEDGHDDELKIEFFRDSNERKMAVDNLVGPLKLLANVPLKITIGFSEKDEMALALRLIER